MKEIRKKKFIWKILPMAMVAGVLSGCGAKMPELSDEDMEKVTNYAAQLLLEHDTLSPSRLVSEEDLLEKEKKDREKEEKRKEQEKLREEEEKQKQEEEQKKNEEHQPSEIILPSKEVSENLDDMREILNLDGNVSLVYTGYEICNSYPETGSAGYDNVTSGDREELLVLHFELQNAGDAQSNVDILHSKAFFQIQVNDGARLNAMTTILEDDLGTYIGAVEPIGGTVPKVVLIREYPSDSLLQLKSVYLTAKRGEEAVTVKLQ